MRNNILWFLPFACLLSGCSWRLGDCTLMSTKNICCRNVDLTKLEQKTCVYGKDIRFWGIGSNIQDAADKALEKGEGNLLIDPVVYYESIPLICGGYVVKGTVVNVPYVDNSNASQESQKQNTGKFLGYRVKQDPSTGKYTKIPIYDSNSAK